MFKTVSHGPSHGSSHNPSSYAPQDRSGAPGRAAPRIPVIALGMSLASFFALTFVLCVLFDLWFPSLAMNRVWTPLLPGFTWISWSSFFLGLAETFAYGWYIALIVGPLFNLFSAKYSQGAQG
jgi:hypothetical protein|tara:strand:- start:2325 stop:2693 length:369 start_codon:yes stop_codon:yes gene_type:complete